MTIGKAMGFGVLLWAALAQPGLAQGGECPAPTRSSDCGKGQIYDKNLGACVSSYLT